MLFARCRHSLFTEEMILLKLFSLTSATELKFVSLPLTAKAVKEMHLNTVKCDSPKSISIAVCVDSQIFHCWLFGTYVKFAV